jgi:hypothetical protein
MPLEVELESVVDDVDAARGPRRQHCAGVARWKGPTRESAGYKVRHEISARTGDPVELAVILDQLECEVIAEIDRRDA